MPLTDVRLNNPADPLELGQRTGHLIWRAQQRAWRVFMEEAAGFDITPVQANILLVIGAQSGLDQKTLAKIVALDPATAGNVLGRLETRGLVVRKADKTDRRARSLFLTAAGRAMNRKMGAVTQRTRERLLEDFTPRERTAFTQLLRKFGGLTE